MTRNYRLESEVLVNPIARQYAHRAFHEGAITEYIRAACTHTSVQLRHNNYTIAGSIDDTHCKHIRTFAKTAISFSSTHSSDMSCSAIPSSCRIHTHQQ